DPVTGEVRLVTVRKVKDHPLWVSVSTNKNDIFKSSWSTFQLLAIAGLLLTLIVLVAMEQILRTETKARQKAEQLRLTLEHMSQGIMLVTKELEIPIINGRCAELLDLPTELIDNPPRFDQLVAYQVDKGESGDTLVPPSDALVDSASATSDGPVAVRERRMQNGKVVEVRSGRLPDGSFVETFTDITQRWEAEAHVARLAS